YGEPARQPAAHDVRVGRGGSLAAHRSHRAAVFLDRLDDRHSSGPRLLHGPRRRGGPELWADRGGWERRPGAYRGGASEERDGRTCDAEMRDPYRRLLRSTGTAWPAR